MAVKPQILLIPDRPIFNKEESLMFETFSLNDSAFLYSTLYLNYKNVFARSKVEYEITYFFDEKDKDFLPEEFQPDEIIKRFLNKSDDTWNSVSRYIEKKIQSGSTSLLIIFANSIGVSPLDLSRIFNLLNYDDNNIVLGKSTNNYLCFIGINYFEELLFSDLKSFQLKYDDYLMKVNPLNNFLFTNEGFYIIKDISDFQNLYKVLSTKESIEFCNHEIHELFTHLFIEYKGLL